MLCPITSKLTVISFFIQFESTGHPEKLLLAEAARKLPGANPKTLI